MDDDSKGNDVWSRLNGQLRQPQKMAASINRRRMIDQRDAESEKNRDKINAILSSSLGPSSSSSSQPIPPLARSQPPSSASSSSSPSPFASLIPPLALSALNSSVSSQPNSPRQPQLPQSSHSSVASPPIPPSPPRTPRDQSQPVPSNNNQSDLAIVSRARQLASENLELRKSVSNLQSIKVLMDEQLQELDRQRLSLTHLLSASQQEIRRLTHELNASRQSTEKVSVECDREKTKNQELMSRTQFLESELVAITHRSSEAEEALAGVEQQAEDTAQAMRVEMEEMLAANRAELDRLRMEWEATHKSLRDAQHQIVSANAERDVMASKLQALQKASEGANALQSSSPAPSSSSSVTRDDVKQILQSELGRWQNDFFSSAANDLKQFITMTIGGSGSGGAKPVVGGDAEEVRALKKRISELEEERNGLNTKTNTVLQQLEETEQRFSVLQSDVQSLRDLKEDLAASQKNENELLALCEAYEEVFQGDERLDEVMDVQQRILAQTSKPENNNNGIVQ